MLTFVDETGADRRNCLRQFGYSIRGRPEVSQKLFIQHILLPHLHPFHGINPHSVVVMDNASIHHISGVAHLIESTGALLYPDLNPMEEAFFKLKSDLRASASLLDTVLDCESLVLNSFSPIARTDCCQWIQHAGYN